MCKMLSIPPRNPGLILSYSLITAPSWCGCEGHKWKESLYPSQLMTRHKCMLFILLSYSQVPSMIVSVWLLGKVTQLPFSPQIEDVIQLVVPKQS